MLGRMDQEIRDAELNEDRHTGVRYLSWSAKVGDKWEPRTAVVRPGQSHPVLEARKSLEERSRLS